MAVYTVGQVLPNGATVTSDTVVTGADGSTSETMVDSARNRTVIFTPAAGAPLLNAASLQSKGIAALTSNATYQAIASPTTAQVNAQVLALTKAVNALIRLQIGQLDSTTGT